MDERGIESRHLKPGDVLIQPPYGRLVGVTKTRQGVKVKDESGNTNYIFDKVVKVVSPRVLS
jgi:hypothetical protein